MVDEELEWIVDESNAGVRLDKFIAERSPDEVSRTQVQGWIKEGLALVDGQPVKPNWRVAAGQTVALAVPEPTVADVRPEPIPLEIVYEDGDVIVVNKPRGLVVHPAAGHPSGTLVNGLLYHCHDLSGINGEKRPGIVHRIDKDTSGLLVAAKNDGAHQSLSAQLQAHTVTRRYIAIVHGVVPHEQGSVDAPLGRDPHDRKLFAVNVKHGKRAVTHFRVIERFADYTLLELQLETGRTHQIRVHLKFIGHPLVGDPVYGRNKGVTMNGQALHAAVLGFNHPTTGHYMEYEAPLPDDMHQTLHIIRNL